MPRTDLAAVYEHTSQLCEGADVEAFAIGSTTDFALTQSSLQAQDLVSVYEADSPEDAAEVEEALLARFASNARCANEDVYEADTATSDDEAVISVFVAIWRTS